MAALKMDSMTLKCRRPRPETLPTLLGFHAQNLHSSQPRAGSPKDQ